MAATAESGWQKRAEGLRRPRCPAVHQSCGGGSRGEGTTAPGSGHGSSSERFSAQEPAFRERRDGRRPEALRCSLPSVSRPRSRPPETALCSLYLDGKKKRKSPFPTRTLESHRIKILRFQRMYFSSESSWNDNKFLLLTPTEHTFSKMSRDLQRP